MIKIFQLLTALTIVFSMSCTRNSSENVIISLTHPGAQSVGALRVLIVNVSGSGFTPIYYMWQHCDHSDPSFCPPGTSTAPTQLEFEIPKGSNRFFQVLAAYEDPTNFSVSFQYDDETKNLVNTSETVTINLVPIGGVNGKKFDFGGRYCRNAGGTDCPSGLVTSMYTPPGKPAMKIESTYMFDGYFKLFGIDGANFKYDLVELNEAKSTIFNNVNLDAASFPDADYMLRLDIPTHYEWEMSTSTWRGESAKSFIFGFFGPSGYSTGKQSCYLNTVMNNLSYMCVDTSCVPTSGGGAAADSRLDWDPVFSGTEGNVLNDEIQRPSGGVSSVACTTVEATIDNFSFTPLDLVAGGEDKILRFNGPFKYGNNFVLAYQSTDEILWNYVSNPGVGKIFDGISIFRKNISGPYDFDEDTLDCAKLVAGGFELLTDITTVDPNLEDTTASGDISYVHPAGLNTNDIIFMCPYKSTIGNKKYLIGAALYTQAI